MLDALSAIGAAAEAIEYSDETAQEVEARLRGMDAVLVWVDPLSGSEDRTVLDEVLRQVAAAGVLVSAHPDVILKMGTKDVLFDTRSLGWGTETDVYRTVEEFHGRFPRALAGGPRVLKQYRGNGGIGVWKVELAGAPAGHHAKGPDEATSATRVRVQHAKVRDDSVEHVALGAFMQRCATYFAAGGRLIDQPFQPRIVDGMIRCYVVRDVVVGFARQYPPELSADGAAISGNAFGLDSAKTMHPSNEPMFQMLRHNLENEWLPGLQRLVGIETDALPVLWDADFLFGPRNAAGEDTYVLCEINASSVLPFPPDAPGELARVMRTQLLSRAQS